MNFKDMDLTELYDLKLKAEDSYFNSGNPIMSDFYYDKLLEIIKTKDDSYIEKIGIIPTDSDLRVKIPFYLGSMNKIKPSSFKEFERWKERNISAEYIFEPKLDGISCLLVKKKGKINMYTRGNGIYGTDITHMYKYMNIGIKTTKDINLRGELIINKNIFNSKYKDEFSNPRNFVSGVVMSKNINKTHIKDIDFIGYEIITENKLQKEPSSQLREMKSINVKTVSYTLVQNRKLNIENMIKTLNTFKNSLDYHIDGIVVQSNLQYVRNIEGNPKYAFAFKIQGESYKTKVKNVLWQVSKWGKIKPRIVVEEIDIDGVKINYTTGFNAKYIIDNKIGKDSIVSITRSGDVIPYITDVIKYSNNIIYPNIQYKWDENNIDFETLNETDTQKIKMLVSFFSKLDIKHISFEITSKLYFHGFDTIFKIIEAKKEDFKKIDGFQDKLSDKIYTNIQNGINNASIPKILSAYGLFGYGISDKKINKLFKDLPNILDDYNTKSHDELYKSIMNVDGFSNKSADKIIKNLHKAKLFINKMNKYTDFKTTNKQKKITNSPFTGKSIVFSGFRDKQLQDFIEECGGNVSNSISTNTFILIIKNIESSKTSKKQKDAIKLNIPITDVNLFKEKYKINI